MVVSNKNNSKSTKRAIVEFLIAVIIVKVLVEFLFFLFVY